MDIMGGLRSFAANATPNCNSLQSRHGALIPNHILRCNQG
jgi:hypothetical protein